MDIIARENLMTTGKCIGFVTVCILLAIGCQVEAQEQTVGLFLNDSTSFEGYTLFAPMQFTTTYLIDNNGMIVNKWESDYLPGLAAYLCENGSLLRTGNLGVQPTFLSGGRGGIIQEFDWDRNLIWEFEYSSDQCLQHHDIEQLPNGNVLMIAWENISATLAIAAGRDPEMLNEAWLWPDHVIEVEPGDSVGGTIVWKWHVWDHLIQDFDSTKANFGVVADHPELIDLNYTARPNGPDMGNPDWLHTNSIDYNAEFDQIILSAHNFCEIWVIDHSTTTEEAAGHSGGNSGKGGDLLYRWGNPQAYRAGTMADVKFFAQHDARWIESGHPGEGNILVFNNGLQRPHGQYSSVDEIVPPVDSVGNYFLIPGSAYEPEDQIWIYTAENPLDFYSRAISGAQRLPNGNTLVCDGDHGEFFEVSPDTEIVWLYINPVIQTGPLMQGDPIPEDPNGGPMNPVFRILRYAPDYPGFQGHQLIPGDPVEIYPENIDDLVIDYEMDAITLRWSPILNPLAVYYIYASDDPLNFYSPVDSTTNCNWSTSVGSIRRFYRVTFEIAP